MELRATPLVRCLRAGLLAAVVVAVGSTAHVSAAGAMPGWSGLATLYVVVAAVCAALLGREASPVRLLALTVGGQLAVHGALSALAGHTVVATSAATHAGHGAAHHVATSSAGSPSWLTHGIDDLLAHPMMTTLHVLAAAVVGLWLAVGERALWSLVRLARCTARTLLAAAATALCLHPVVLHSVRRAVGVRPVAVDPLPLLPLWSRGSARRGPPLLLLPH